MFSTIVFFILGLFGCKSINQNDIPGIWVVSEESRTRYIPTEKKMKLWL